MNADMNKYLEKAEAAEIELTIPAMSTTYYIIKEQYWEENIVKREIRNKIEYRRMVDYAGK